MTVKNKVYSGKVIGTSMGKLTIDDEGYTDSDSNTEAMLVRTFGFISEDRPVVEDSLVPEEEVEKVEEEKKVEETPKKKPTTRKTTRKVTKKETEE